MTPDRVKVFLDDLARLSMRYGITIGFELHDGAYLVGLYDGFQGYTVGQDGGLWGIGQLPIQFSDVCSLDVSQLSNHERLQVMGGQS